MALSHAERQRRYRERRKAQQTPVHYRRPRDRRSRPQRWRDAVEALRELQEDYQEWLDHLPDNLQSTALAEQLDEVCSLGLEPLDLDLPRGFGRD